MTDALAIGTSWWQLIDERASRTPDRPFLSDEAGRSLTFGEYRRRAEEVAAGLLGIGVEPDHVVSWQLPTNLEAAVLMAGLSRLGVRQNPIIPILRRAEVSLITSQLDSDWLVVPGTYRGFDYVAMATEAIGERGCRILSTEEFAGGDLALPLGDPTVLPAAVDPGDDERWYYYSSGTTATPKGARHTDASTMSSSIGVIEFAGINGDDMFGLPFPITHIGGIMLLTAYTRVGGQLLFIEAFDPVESPQLMAERGVTIFGSATPFFRAYLAAQARHGDEPLFPKLRQLQAGGAPITPELNDECQRVFGVPIINQWGLTEFPAATSLSPDAPQDKFHGSVGRMVPGAEVKVIGFDGERAGAGTEGELWVRGPQQCKGYVDSSLDADAFDADGFFRTGDLGTVDADGYLRITGRLKDIIIRNAENLSASEIEDTLIEHPAIADVAVVGVPDERTGERACAIVVLAPGHDSVTIAELAEHCDAHGLAKQKIPEQLEIASELPRNPMGKVLKHELRAKVLPKA